MIRKQVPLFMLVVGLALSAAPIKNIEISNNTEVPEELILSNIKMKVGEEYNSDLSAEDIARLKGLKYFNDVTIKTEESSEGVIVKINVTDKQNVKNLLREEGIFNLTPVVPVAPTEQFVASNVGIYGNKHFTSKDILSMANITKTSGLTIKDLEDARARLLASGYFKSVISNNNPEKPSLVVEENPVIKGIQIHGNSAYTIEQIKSLLTNKEGQILNVVALQRDAEKLKEAYQKSGYAVAGIQGFEMDDNNILHVQMLEGIVRKIEIRKMNMSLDSKRRTPNDDILKTKDYVIDREVTIQPGKVFRMEDYETTVNNLMRLGIFRNISFEANPVDGSDQLIDIVLLLDEDRTASIQAGASYGTESGFAGNVSIKDDNWAGKNQQLSFSLEKSTRSDASISLSFFDPWIKDTNRVSWGWGAYKNTYGSSSQVFNVTRVLGFRTNIGKGLNANTSLNIGAKFEYLREQPNYTLFKPENIDSEGTWTNPNPNPNDPNKLPEKITGLNDKYYVASINPYLIYDTRNNPYNPTKGLYGKVQVELGYTTGYKGGYFSSANLDLRSYHKGFWDKNSFAYRLQAGAMTASAKEAQKFWVGGGNTIRGYDSGWFRGNKKAVFTVENRTQINDMVGVVLFADMGRAWDYSLPDLPNGRDYPTYVANDTNLYGNIGIGVGAGLRFNTPIGPLRFDLGWPIGKVVNGQKEKSEMKFYFNMGHSF